ncbi:MAG TPA: cupin domain-containing protein [Caulobacteraceae bacterium]|nr:cupin domain-containing protein [Caulobacteraceae bacterium]
MIARTALALCALALVSAAPPAGPPGVDKVQLQEQPFPGPSDHTVLFHTRIARGAGIPPHTHPGIEMTYVLQGRALVKIAGRPDLRVAAGDSFSIADGVVHSVRNVGSATLTLVSTYVVDKDKPLASPATGAP